MYSAKSVSSLCHEQVIRTVGLKFFPFGIVNIRLKQELIFAFPQSPEVSIMNFGRLGLAWFFHQQTDGYSLLNVKDIFVFTAIWSNLFLLGVAVQVKNINISKSVHQRLAHAAEGGVIQVGVISDKAQDTLPGALYPPLPEGKEFHIVIL